MSADTDAAARAKLHRQGVQAIHDGSYKQAVRLFENCLERFGPHVGPLSDLALTHYLLEDMGSFSLAMERLETEARKGGQRLSRENRIRCHMAMSKCYELAGRVADAFDEIEACLKLLTAGHVLNFQARSQKLRLLATFGKEDEAAEVYQQCLSVSEADPQVMIECFHALLVAEVRLFGLGAAWPRFLHLAKNPELNAADLRLCLIDLLEAALEKGDISAQKNILAFLDTNPSGDLGTYEAAIVHMARTPGSTVSPEEVFGWTRTIPPSAIARLLALELRRNPAASPELKKQLIFRLQAFDHRSRKLLAAKWREAIAEKGEVRLNLDPEKKTVTLGRSTLSMAKSPQSWALLNTLAKHGELEPARILKELALASQSQNLEALRVSTIRLNNRLVKAFRLDWVFRFGKTKVTTNPAVRFERG